MSNAKQILAMLQSKADGDDEHFYSIALQVAAAEARQGRRTLAEDLRAAVDKAREKAASDQTVAVPFASPRGDLADLIEMRPPRFDLESVVMNASLRARLDDVVLQQHKRDWLREHGKTPNRRVLFVGPPGSGKTMSAEALAGELRLPLFVIRLESLITRFMGETAAKLRLVFDETARHRGVYLFDEFDAVGGNRGATNDVAEMRRVLNSFLQFMEEPNSTDSVIIGATNYPDLLDPALLRRFDLVMEFCPPTDEEIRTIIKFNLRPMKFPNLKWKSILASAQGLSQSEIARATEDAVKSAILAERKNVTSDDLLRRLNDRREMREAFRPSAVNKQQMASKYSLPHINIESRRERADFKSTNERFPGSPPPRDRQKHGAMLRGQFSQAANDFEQDRPRDERVSPAAGVYLEVELRPNASPDSLERKKSHLKPASAKLGAADTRIVGLFVPEDAKPVLESILADYQSGELTEKGQNPPYKSFVEPIEAIRKARLETFWTDDLEALPQDPNDTIWWEVWCIKSAENALDALAEKLDARCAPKEQRLVFPEHVVVPVLAARATIELMLFARFSITELRRATDTPHFFIDDLNPDEQFECVRRQSFWGSQRPDLREGLAHLVGLIMRRICGEASVAFRWSSV